MLGSASARPTVYHIALVAVFSALGFLLHTPTTFAIDSLRVRVTSHEINQTANHTITIGLQNGSADNGATFTLDYPNDYVSTGLTENDVDIAGSVVGELTTAPDCSGSEQIGIAINTAQDTLTFTLCSGDGGNLQAGETLTIEIGDHATSSGTGNNQITSPSFANTFIFELTSSFDSDKDAVLVTLSDDKVNVTAQVTSPNVIGTEGGPGKITIPPIIELPPILPPIDLERPRFCRIADLNCDTAVDLIDFSILIYWFDRSDPPRHVDLRKDKTVDIRDFSVMAFYWDQ